MCLPHSSVGGTPMRQRSSTSPASHIFDSAGGGNRLASADGANGRVSFSAASQFFGSRTERQSARASWSAERGPTGFDTMFAGKRIGVFASRQFVRATRVAANCLGPTRGTVRGRGGSFIGSVCAVMALSLSCSRLVVRKLRSSVCREHSSTSFRTLVLIARPATVHTAMIADKRRDS
jgi:hypothetical protein